MKKALVIIVIVASLLAGAVVVLGLVTPAGHEVTRAAVFRAKPEQLFDTIADVASAPEWRPGVTQVEMLPAVEGRVRFREETEHGPMTFEVVESTRPGRFVTRIADPDLPMTGGWTIIVTPENGGARVSITEKGEIHSLVMRAFSAFMDMEATANEYLKALGKKHGEEVAPTSG